MIGEVGSEHDKGGIGTNLKQYSVLYIHLIIWVKVIDRISRANVDCTHEWELVKDVVEAPTDGVLLHGK
jgi:hypothetical protein